MTSTGSLSGLFAGRYVLERELGRGGTSIVHLARDTQLRGQVAIKILRPELAESLSAQRFLREVRTTAQLDHPAIVSVVDSGEAEGSLYCVLRYANGGTLRDRLAREKQLPLDDALSLGVEIATALDFAHERGFIHRDVKPENILFHEGRPSLADFGIARALEHAGGDLTTTTGIVRGTPAYMSPEQAAGERELDRRTDIYSLACVLYEAIAGVPVFVGATSQAVIAQRMVHAPRPIRQYRSNASPAVEAVLRRALSVTPADRYQTAREFADALRAAAASPAGPAHWWQSPAARWIGAAVVVVALAGLSARGVSNRMLGAREPADTTRIAIFPVIAADSAAARAGQDLLYSGLQRWRGITPIGPIEMAAQIGRAGTPSDDKAAAAIAGRVHAGRFIRARIGAGARGKSIYGELIDVRSGELHHVQLDVAADSSLPRVYAAVADSLLLRGADPGGTASMVVGSLNLTAAELMVQARAALNDWDIARADSLFTRAGSLDDHQARALLWAAQVRQYFPRPVPPWEALVATAAADTSSLDGKERTMLAALTALSRKRYADACGAYRRLIASDSASFTAWYGLGECHASDNVVVADARAPSGWRFRTSYQPAVVAYVRAFELLPVAYRGLQRDGFARLRSILYTDSRHIRLGQIEGDPTRRFYGRAMLDHDTIVFSAVPVAASAAGASLADPAKARAALSHLRDIERRLAASWASALPRAAGAKQALAIALEQQGDPAAVDTLRAAQALATDSAQRLRLGAARALTAMKFTVLSDMAGLRAARALADSLLAANPTATAADAEALAPLAAMTGDCDRTAALLAASAPSSLLGTPVPRSIIADARARSGYVALGCAPPSRIPTVDALRAALPDGLNAAQRLEVNQQLFLMIATLSDSVDAGLLASMEPGGNRILAARRELAAGHADSARRLLEAARRSREGSAAGDATPDAIYPEARLLVQLGDTSMAITVLQEALNGARAYAPLGFGDAQARVAWVASLVRCLELRSVLAGDANGRERWRQPVAVLWPGRSAESNPTSYRRSP